MLVLCPRGALAADPRFGEDFAAAPPVTATGAVEIVIVHTNDLHGQVYPQKALWLGVHPPPEAGGFAALASAIRKEREAATREGKGFLLLDAGDIWSGTPEGRETEGRVIVDWMNMIGYDAMTIGNHEFDAGAERVEPLARTARFPWLGGNVVLQATGRRPDFLLSAVDRIVAGVKVSIVGVIATETKVISSARAVRGFDFHDAVDAAREAAQAARARGAEAVILLSHCGIDRDKEMAATIRDVDAVIGGHTHTPVDPAWMHPKTKILVAATGQKGAALGRVSLSVERKQSLIRAEREQPRRVTARAGKLVPIMTADWPADAETEAVLAREAAKIHATYGEVLGETDADVTREPGYVSSALGNWIADLMRDAVQADIAIHNKGGVRADIPAGPIRLYDAFNVSPYANTLTSMVLTGAEVREELEHAFADLRYAVEVSGIEVRYDLDRPSGDRVIRLRRGGEPLSLTAKFRVVTNSFLGRGGDGHVVLTRGEERKEHPIEIMRLHADDIRKRGKVRFGAPEARVAPAESTVPGRKPE